MILPVKTQCRRHRRVMEVILLKQKQIKCPYCHAHASLRPASLVYGSTPQTRGKFLYVCDRWPACNAYVSAHERTLLPMGTLANGDLRHKRILAHRALAMDEDRLPELPQEAFRPMIAQSVQLEQFLGEELIFCFRDLDGVHTFTTCYGDIYKTVNALRDYVRLLESVCDQWELTGFHRATYEYHAEKLRKIADKLQAGIGYDYDKAVERCKRKRAQKSHSSDVGEDALLLTVRAADKSTDNEKEAAPYEEDTPWEPELE